MAETEKSDNFLKRYIVETRGEMRKVTWPTREESWRLTLIVLGTTILFAAFLWVFDTVFSNGIQYVLQLLTGA